MSGDAVNNSAAGQPSASSAEGVSVNLSSLGAGAHRFWDKVTKLPGVDSCWYWNAAKHHSKGYGHFRLNGTMHQAHRVAWLLTFGCWPTQDLLHSCDKVWCVNPSHLSEGTSADNNQDRHMKGRTWCKVTPEQVVEIRRRHTSGETGRDLALEYNVSESNISVIVNWKSRLSK